MIAKATIEDGHLVVTVDNFVTVAFSMEEVQYLLSDEEGVRLAEVLCGDAIYKAAIKRLSGDAYWAEHLYDQQSRADFLASVTDKVAKDLAAAKAQGRRDGKRDAVLALEAEIRHNPGSSSLLRHAISVLKA